MLEFIKVRDDNWIYLVFITLSYSLALSTSVKFGYFVPNISSNTFNIQKRQFRQVFQFVVHCLIPLDPLNKA